MRSVGMLFVFMGLAACSNKGVYEGVQASNRFECSKLPPSQYNECIENSNQSYGDYNRSRQVLLEE